MNARELIEALRSEDHHELCPVGYNSPCRCPVEGFLGIAADRIEALLDLPGNTHAPHGPKALVESILNGESE